MNPRRRRFQRLRRAEARKPIGRAFTRRARRKDWPDRMIAKILYGG